MRENPNQRANRRQYSERSKKAAVFTQTLSACALMATALPAVGQEAFQNATQPGTASVSPASPREEQARFTLPPGFEIELVASEEQGARKTVTIAWDDAGRMWAITALEYPLDGNEQPELARELYKKGGRDRVLVFDNPYAPQPEQGRVFADGLAMPMGILPYKDGALVGDGPEVSWFHDTDGDGRADKKEVILSGFGVQDSHLMPHQFTRAPGGWFYLAQGAFNYSKVKTRDGEEHTFNQTRLARFTADGMKFEDLTCGPCNIWGLVIGREGETFIQEANDFGYPVMAYHQGASYPGCSGTFKPYSPYFPSEVEFRMGGTGLSGLALSDPKGSFPGAYADVMYVANPITRKIQAIKVHRNGPWYRYELLGDFVLSSDEWFRPVSIHFGPDGCLYIVDWYNKIISHNEVPRNHPERDKTRGRIWRVRHKQQSRHPVPNIAATAERDLLKYFTADSTWEMRAAWHQIVDRGLTNAAPDLLRIASDTNACPASRIHAFWCLEELKQVTPSLISTFTSNENRNFRREAIRSLTTLDFSADEVLEIIKPLARDEDPEVRAEVIRVAALHASTRPEAFALLAEMARPPLDGPIGKNPQTGAPMKLREAYDREFERYLIRAAMEKMPTSTKEFLQSAQGEALPPENRILLALALPEKESAKAVAAILPSVDRAPNEEEILRLVESISTPESLNAIELLLARPDSSRSVVESLLKVRNRLDTSKISALLEKPLKELWNSGEEEFAARAGGAFKVGGLEGTLNASLTNTSVPPKTQVAAIRALRELDAGNVQSLVELARNSKQSEVRLEALNSLAASKGDAAARAVLEFWPSMNAVQHRTALRQIGREKSTLSLLVIAVRNGDVPEADLDGESLDRIHELLPEDETARALVEKLASQFKPVLRLDGDNDSYVDANITLDGPFTVETWVKLEPGIGNEDGILGRPGSADFNFAGGFFRVYCGPELGDRAISHKPMVPNTWTHVAVTREAKGEFRLYINGELEIADPRLVTAKFDDLDIGRTTPAKGTAGELTEFRVWNTARSASEIRADFDRTFAGDSLPSGLAHFDGGAGPWKGLKGGAHVEKVSDAPILLTAEQAAAQSAKFERFRKLAKQPGSVEKGKALFAVSCSICHSVAGQGGQIGPVLNGAGASGIETLLRSVITPNAAMETGYRTFRIEMKDGDVLDGFFVSKDSKAILLRQPNAEDRRIALDEIKSAGFTRTSLMPEGLLDSLSDHDARDLLAYLATLK